MKYPRGYPPIQMVFFSKNKILVEEQNKSVNVNEHNKIKKFLNRIRTAKKEKNLFINEENEIYEKIINKKSDLNWFKYILFIICCKRKNSNFSFYQEYRAKFISEENIIQDSLNITRIINILNFDYKQDVDQCSSI